MPYDGIIRSIRRTSTITVCVVTAAFTVAMVLGSALMASILRHFDDLLQKFDRFTHGEWQPVPADPAYAERCDEIGELYRRFDQMAIEHHHLIDDNYIKQQLLAEAQLRQLRAQIQPHFLYNTLESIYCLAKRDGDQQIATMTLSLGRMLRATLKEPRDIIPIGDDLKIAQEYLNVQVIRYAGHLRVCCDVAEEFMSALVPAMTIQPLVENAVRHGAEKMLEQCEIHIFCQRTENYIDLIVADNGPGMDEDTLEQLERGELQPQGLGIGLANIQKRLKLAFHDEGCSLRIRREAERTLMIVRIPSGEECAC